MNLACVFPGQGSQSIGMLSDLAKAHTGVKQTFEEASDTLSLDLWKLAAEGPEETLNNTFYTQPIMLAAGVAVWRVWLANRGCRPEILAGHSFGEYTALVCGGALEFSAALPLVQERARLMQTAVAEGKGSMAAVLGLDDQTVIELCEQAADGEVVQAVNFNAPGQVVIAGHSGAVERAMQAADTAGAKRVVKLAVSVPAHCRLMESAAEIFADQLAGTTIQSPAVPVIHNADVVGHHEPSAIRDTLRRQFFNPVRWAETINYMAEAGIKAVFEFGPGKVLTSLTRRIDRSLVGMCIHDPASLEKALDVCEQD